MNTNNQTLVRRVTDRKALEDRRRLAVERVLAGEPQAVVAQSLRVTVRSVCKWVAAYRANGVAGLQSKKHDGPSPKLTAEQVAEVKNWLQQDPRHFGFRTALWTASRIVDLIYQKFKVTFHPRYFCRWLHRHGFTPQMPGRKAAQRNEEAIRLWPSNTWTEIKKRGLAKRRISS